MSEDKVAYEETVEIVAAMIYEYLTKEGALVKQPTAKMQEGV